MESPVFDRCSRHIFLRVENLDRLDRGSVGNMEVLPRQKLIQEACHPGIFPPRLPFEPSGNLLLPRLSKKKCEDFKVDSFVSESECQLAFQLVSLIISGIEDLECSVLFLLCGSGFRGSVDPAGDSMGPRRQTECPDDFFVSNKKRAMRDLRIVYQ